MMFGLERREVDIARLETFWIRALVIHGENA